MTASVMLGSAGRSLIHESYQEDMLTSGQRTAVRGGLERVLSQLLGVKAAVALPSAAAGESFRPARSHWRRRDAPACPSTVTSGLQNRRCG